MKRRLRNTIGILLFTTMTGCFRPEVTTLLVSVPEMGSIDCSRVILDKLGSVEGVVNVQPDTTERTVAVTYKNTKLARRNIEYMIASLGFDANEMKGDASAKEKLPSECR